LRWLREHRILNPPYYLHITQGGAEIGWQARERVIDLAGEPVNSQAWISAIKAIGDQAAIGKTKAFGYIGFDACDSTQGFAPDRSATFPLVQFFIPEHRVVINADQIEYQGNNPEILTSALEAAIAVPPGHLHPVLPDVEFSEQAFTEAVVTAKSCLSEDITKVVLSRYLGFDYDADLLELFSEYCLKQKFADAILMDFNSVGAAIASPELLIRINAGVITANPLAGTRVLGHNPEENHRIARELLKDRKELAEHTLALLQIIRELQPFCEAESLVVSRLLDTVEQNQVMHLSSLLSGRLKANQHCLDATLSLFPSTMVSGVPKPQAIELLRQIEPFPRGLFGGIVGWISGQDCRFALTIRGLYKYGARLFVQAGAGVMAESDPAQESEEIRMKMSAMLEILSSNLN
jgi:anthranilate/para-aminobenzoate synthase component I